MLEFYTIQSHYDFADRFDFYFNIFSGETLAMKDVDEPLVLFLGATFPGKDTISISNVFSPSNTSL
jgi:hypothetical protein